MRFRLRTLLIVSALAPLMLSAAWFAAYDPSDPIGQVLARVVVGVLALTGLWTVIDAMIRG